MTTATLLCTGWLAWRDLQIISEFNPRGADEMREALLYTTGAANVCVVCFAGLNLFRARQLRRLLREWQGTLDSVQDAIWVMDTDLRIQRYNKAAGEFFNRPPKQIIGQRCCELVHGTLNQVLGCPEACMAASGRRESAELKLGERWFTAIADPLFARTGKRVGAVHILKDITGQVRKREEMREYSRRLAAHNENSPLAIIEMDSTLKITCWAGAAEKIFSWSAEEVLGQHIDSLRMIAKNPREDLPPVQSLRVPARSEKATQSNAAFRSYTKIGTTVYCDWHNTIVRDPAGNVTSVRCLVNNVTAQKEAEFARDKLLRKLDSKRALLQTVLQQMPVGVVIEEVSTGKVRTNEQSNRIFRGKAARTDHMEEFATCKLVTADGAVLPMEARPLTRSLHKSETIRGEEIHLERCDGRRALLDVNSAPVFDSHGTLVAAVAIFNDITSRKQTEESLRLSEERFRVAILNSPVNVSSQDLSLRYTWTCNQQLGYSPEEVIGKTDFELLPPSTAKQVDQLKRQVLATGKAIRQQISLPTAKTALQHDFTIEPLRDESGEIIGVISVVVDVTESRNAQEALRKSEANYRRLVETANEGIWTVNRQGITTYVNQRMADLFGYTPDEILGQPLTKFMCEEDLPKTNYARTSRLASISGQWDQQFVRKDGTRVWVLSSCCPLHDESGDFSGVLGFFTDITRRKLQDTFRNALNAINAGIHSQIELPQILEQTVSIAAQAIGSESAAIFLKNEDRWQISHAFGLPKGWIGAIRSDEEEPQLALAGDSMGPIALNNAATDERLKSSLVHLMGVRSQLVVPLITQSRVIGGMYFNFHSKPFAFEQTHLDFATQLASSIALATDNSRLFAEFQQELAHRMEVQQQIVLLNITLEKQVHKRTAELQKANAKLRSEIIGRRRLEEEILHVSEAEQKRLGQDLHDDLGQQLTGLSMFSTLLERSLKKESHADAVKAEELSHMLRATIQSTRDLAKGFYPIELERGGLIMALLDLTHRVTAQTQIRCEFRHNDSFQFPEEKAIHLYRIAQEAINNSIKHGKPRNILVECACLNGVSTLRISDDGEGFKPEADGQGMGLHLFQYRARLVGASIEVKNLPAEGSRGCQVTCSLGSFSEDEKAAMTAPPANS